MGSPKNVSQRRLTGGEELTDIVGSCRSCILGTVLLLAFVTRLKLFYCILYNESVDSNKREKYILQLYMYM